MLVVVSISKWLRYLLPTVGYYKKLLYCSLDRKTNKAKRKTETEKKNLTHTHIDV